LPTCGRRQTYRPTPINAASTIGVNASFGSSLASEAPIADPSADAMTSGNTVHESSGIRSAYVHELVAVPQNEEILFVPKIIAGGVLLGSPISRAGSWISPPPPTTASTQPATNAARISAASDSVERSDKWGLSPAGLDRAPQPGFHRAHPRRRPRSAPRSFDPALRSHRLTSCGQPQRSSASP